LKYNNENECGVNNGVWKVVEPYNLPPPECLEAAYSRDNHLGNGLDGELLSYTWTIPDDPHENCVLRLRYNISTGEYPFNLTADANGGNSPIKQDQIVDIGVGHPLEMALNTNQYGRTFQDRSYVFAIRKRPEDIPANARIYNLNVRGKRGNIVQTFPAMEYDFVPRVLHVTGDDYIHIQWTGSDYNPDRDPNDGEGGPRDPTNNQDTRADRNNLVQVDDLSLNIPRHAQYNTMFLNEDGTPDIDTIRKLAFAGIDIFDGVSCLNYTQLLQKNNNDKNEAEKDNQNCYKINAKSPYFNLGLVKMRANGRFAYISTRNNNFSNRSQKGLIIVTGAKFASASKVVATFVLSVLSVVATLFFSL
jgi:hypothetical protein